MSSITTNQTLFNRYKLNPKYFDYDCGKKGKAKLCCNEKCLPCYQRSFAVHERSQHWSNFNIESPRQAFLNSSKKYWFDCSICKHKFECSLGNINYNQRWCPYCSHQKLCDNNDCNFCHINSYASHEKAIYWSYNLNKEVPRMVFKQSTHVYFFNCPCGHTIRKKLHDTTRNEWCPYCSSPPKKLCDKDDCDHCFQKSFASNDKAKYWSKINNKAPREVFSSSGTKFYFDCECGHRFNSALNNITFGFWCPYCSDPPKQLCNDPQCDTCYNKSFASNEKAKYWSPRNKKLPREIFRGSADKFWFKCENDHEFKSVLNSINRGTWCPKCTGYKTEAKLLIYLQKTSWTIEPQKKFDWCKNPKTNKFLSFDFYIPELQLIIELDGLQHFEQVSSWTSPEKTRARDIFKMKQCMAHGLTVIRLLQDDVWYDKNDWEVSLQRELIMHLQPTIIYLAQNDEYNLYINEMRS